MGLTLLTCNIREKKENTLKYLTIIILIFISSASHANERMTLDEFCKVNPCRKDLTIKLKRIDGSDFQNIFKLLPPAVQPAFISIYAGETLYIEANEGKDAPTDFIQVKEMKNPEKTIVFILKQKNKMGDAKSMLLTVINPFSKDIRYSMGMMPLDKERLIKTSSCPVLARKSTFEIWPFPIFQIVVGNIHFKKKNDDGVCK